MVGDRVAEVPLLMFVQIGLSKVGIREGTGKTGLILICSGICTLSTVYAGFVAVLLSVFPNWILVIRAFDTLSSSFSFYLFSGN